MKYHTIQKINHFHQLDIPLSFKNVAYQIFSYNNIYIIISFLVHVFCEYIIVGVNICRYFAALSRFLNPASVKTVSRETVAQAAWSLKLGGEIVSAKSVTSHCAVKYVLSVSLLLPATRWAGSSYIFKSVH